MIDVDEEKFKKAKEEAEKFYKSVGNTYCPYFQDKIIFNAKGIEHIKFKARRKARSAIDQYMRLRLLSLAPKIINKSHTLQGLSEAKSFEYESINSRWQNVLRNVVHYEFIAVIKKTRVRIIIKQVENGPKFFWSIIPFWKMNNQNYKRILHSGNPEID